MNANHLLTYKYFHTSTIDAVTSLRQEILDARLQLERVKQSRDDETERTHSDLEEHRVKLKSTNQQLDDVNKKLEDAENDLSLAKAAIEATE